MAMVSPELFETVELNGQVETGNGSARGFTIFDRREFPDSRPNMEVAIGMDVGAVEDGILRGLKYAGQQSPS